MTRPHPSIAQLHRDQILLDLKRTGMSISELAERAGLDRAGLSRFLGRVTDNPTVGYLDKLHAVMRRAKARL